MKNFLILLLLCASIGVLIFIGASFTFKPFEEPKQTSPSPTVPHLGSIELLNGCGIDGVAQEMAEYLRSHSFDVKNIGNAPTFNYDSTLVISRTYDTTMAASIAAVLKTDKIAIIQNNQHLYDVTVFIGADYKERMQ